MNVRLMTALFLLLSGALIWAAGQTETEAADEEPVELSFYNAGGGNYPYDQAVTEEIYGRFNELVRERINAVVDVNVIGSYGDYNQKMPVLLASGEEMDLLWTSSWSNNYLKAASDDLYVELSELLPQHAPSAYAAAESLLPSLTVDGGLYGISLGWNSLKGVRVQVREDLVPEYRDQLENLESMEDLAPILRDIKETHAEVTPLGPRNGVINWMYGAMKFVTLGLPSTVPLVVRYDDPEMEVLNVWETPEFRNAHALANSWYNDGIIEEDVLALSADQLLTQYYAAQYGIVLHNSYDPTIEFNTYGDYKYHWFLLGDMYLNPGSPLSSILSISYTSEHPVKTTQLIELLFGDSEVYNTIAYGLEGLTYETVGDNRIRFLDDHGYANEKGWQYGWMPNGFLMENDPPGKYEIIAEASAEAAQPHTMGFVPVTEDWKTIIANVSAVSEQYQLPLYIGAAGEELYQEYLGALEQAGIDELKDAIQQQVDAWAAGN